MTEGIVVVSGTGTGVGKTWVTARLVRALRAQGVACTARKPAQSYDPGQGPTDAEVLAMASGEDPGRVTPPHRWYEVAAAPPMAADILGRPKLSLQDLVDELQPLRRGIAFVEGVGGPRSPLAHDGDTVALALALHADAVLLVSGAGLGSINAVLLAAAVFSRPPLVFLNRFDPADDLHLLNRAWLREVEGIDACVTVPELVERLGRHPLEVG